MTANKNPKIKNIHWRQMTVNAVDVARVLTELNFQPGKFHLINSFPNRVIIVFVEAEW